MINTTTKDTLHLKRDCTQAIHQTPAMVESPPIEAAAILSHAACPRSRIAWISRSFGHTPTASTGIASSVAILRSSSRARAKNSPGRTDM